MRLYQAVDASQLSFKVSADTTIFLKGNPAKKMAFNKTLIPKPTVTSRFMENVLYTLTAPAGDSFSLSIYSQIDTFNLTNLSDAVQLEHSKGLVSVIHGGDTLSWVNKSYVTIYSILGGYKGGLPTRPDSVGRWLNFGEFAENYQNNPFLSSIVNRVILKDGDTLHMPQQVRDSVMANIRDIRSNRFFSDLNNLLEGEKTTTDYLISIRDVQLEYQTPTVSNFNTLSGISDRIKLSQSLQGQSDFSTVLIAGLSDFIVERAQEEFNVAFMNRLKERLDSIPELRVLFPRSQLFFDQIDITNYKSLLASARDAFIADIRNIGVNFPLLFTLDKYKELNDIPAVYNLISIYKVVDLVYRGVPIDTLLPLAFHELRDRQKNLDKEINLKVAKDPKKSGTIAALSARIGHLEDSLVAVRKTVSEKELTFYNNISLAYVLALTPERIAKVDEIYYRALPALSQPYAALKNAWDTTQLIPNYLLGKYNYEYLLENPRIEQFGKYFDQAPDSVALVGAGLQLASYLVNGINGGSNKAEIIQRWSRRVDFYNTQLNDLMASFKPKDTTAILQSRLDSLNQVRKDLQSKIIDDIPYWNRAGATQQDTMSLRFLAKTLRFFYYPDQRASTIADSVRFRRQFLLEVSSTVQAQLDSLQTRLKTTGRSPLQQFFYVQDSLNNVLRPLSPTQRKIRWLLKESESISQSLDTIRQNCCGELIESRKNAQVVGGAVELSSFLLNSFQSARDTNKWMTLNQFNHLTGNQLSRDIFLGLIFQQLQNIPIAKGVSSQGVAALTSDFVSTLSDINLQLDTIAYRKIHNQQPTFKDYLPFVAASVTLMNQVLETPLLVKTDTSGNRMPINLIQQYPVLKDIPEVSRTILALFENASNENYRYAVTNVVSLIETLTANLDQDCSKNKKLTKKQRKACEEKSKARLYLIRYGNFIADVAVATSADEVKTALDNVALPPGSSWTKRIDPYNVSLNAYFGAAVGRENLSNQDNGKLLPINSFSLSVPVGITFSAKWPRRMKGSWSLFLPVIDLGAISAYRVNEPENRLPVLSFQNIISPGIHVMYNFAKSPFYVGTGWQYGPEARRVTENGVEVQRSASRFLLTFGVDVPIFNLYKVNKD